MNFITAFIQEAIPLIEELELIKEEISSPFILFQNKKHRLVISGMGAQNMSLAVSFLHGIYPCTQTPWLNLGLCGHGNAELGDALHIAKCQDPQSGKTIYPPQLFSTSFPKAILHTVDQPTTEYKTDLAYDMEGMAYFETANRFAPPELVQAVKIVSDNPQNPFSQFKKKQTSTLISPHIPEILSLISSMEDLALELEPHPQLSLIIDQALALHSFTETQFHQLKKLTRQALILGLTPDEISQITQSRNSAKSIITLLHNQLEQKRIFP